PPPPPLFPYTTLFRSPPSSGRGDRGGLRPQGAQCRSSDRQRCLKAPWAQNVRLTSISQWRAATGQRKTFSTHLQVVQLARPSPRDRKSTRLNSSHVKI